MLRAICSILLIGSSTLSQVPGRRPSWRALSAESTIIIVGVVEEIAQLVYPEKMRATQTSTSDGRVIATLPERQAYEAGGFVRLRIDEVISGEVKLKTKDLVIAQPGFLPREGDAPLLKGEKYVVFLKPVPPDRVKELARASVFRIVAGQSELTPFDPRSAYTIVREGYGAVPIKPGDSKITDEIKAALRGR